jgi:hypothetical protein
MVCKYNLCPVSFFRFLSITGYRLQVTIDIDISGISQTMIPSTIYQSHDVVAYWPEGSNGSLVAEENALNIAYRARAVDIRELTIHDSRSNIGDFTLDKNGFQVWTLPDTPTYTKDDQKIESEQYPEIIEALKKL